MQVEIISLFPEIFSAFLEGSLVGKACAAGILQVRVTSPREYAEGSYRQTDDTPYGGGPGMVMKPEPLVASIEAVVAARGPAHRILLSPQGEPLRQARVRELATMERLLLVCGRYEGFDERVRGYVDEELSLGDFVLSGGEVAAMAVIEAVSRHCPGVLGKDESAVEESFATETLEYPHYTRPAEFRGVAVPPVLLSGNHERIRRWRRREALLRTQERRPELFARLELSPEDRALLEGEEP